MESGGSKIEVVKKDSDRLSEEAEREPEDEIANDGGFEVSAGDGGRDLNDHANEEVELESFQSDRDDELVEYGGEEENERGGDGFRETVS